MHTVAAAAYSLLLCFKLNASFISFNSLLKVSERTPSVLQYGRLPKHYVAGARQTSHITAEDTWVFQRVVYFFELPQFLQTARH